MEKQVVAGSFSLIKKINTSLILNTIRERGTISRAEIAKLTGLTPATVTNITAELIRYDLVLEAERGESSGGRKPVMLKINSDGYYVIGLNICSNEVELIVSNLNADIIFEDRFYINRFIPSDNVLNTIIHKLKRWIQKNADKKILGIGVGVHGLVSSQKGVSIFAPNLGWENVPIKSMLEEGLGLPVFIDNDVRTMTLGESWFGSARDISNFVFIYVGYGIGGSIVINNQLYKGITEGAGEIGHTTIEINGPRCSCGNHGCLQALASEQALMQRAEEKLKQGSHSKIKELQGDQTLTPETIYKAAAQDDSIAVELVKEQAKYLGVGIANLINTFNPASIVINGNLAKLSSIVMEIVHNEVQQRSMKFLQNSVNIIFSDLGEKAALKGAVALVLSEIFNNPQDRRQELSKDA